MNHHGESNPYSPSIDSNKRTLQIASSNLPATPTGLRISAYGHGWLKLRWNAVLGVYGYYISYSGGAQNSAKFCYATNCRIDLSNGVTYSFRVRSFHWNGQQVTPATYSAPSAAYAYALPSTSILPATPSGLRVTSSGVERVTLSWNSVSGAWGYYVGKNGGRGQFCSGSSCTIKGLSDAYNRFKIYSYKWDGSNTTPPVYSQASAEIGYLFPNPSNVFGGSISIASGASEGLEAVRTYAVYEMMNDAGTAWYVGKASAEGYHDSLQSVLEANRYRTGGADTKPGHPGWRKGHQKPRLVDSDVLVKTQGIVDSQRAAQVELGHKIYHCRELFRYIWHQRVGHSMTNQRTPSCDSDVRAALASEERRAQRCAASSVPGSGEEEEEEEEEEELVSCPHMGGALMSAEECERMRCRVRPWEC